MDDSWKCPLPTASGPHNPAGRYRWWAYASLHTNKCASGTLGPRRILLRAGREDWQNGRQPHFSQREMTCGCASNLGRRERSYKVIKQAAPFRCPSGGDTVAGKFLSRDLKGRLPKAAPTIEGIERRAHW